MSYTIEKSKGRVALSRLNLFLENTIDMEELEYWEDRLEKLGDPYVIAYRKIDGVICYSIFCNMRKKGSSFK